MTLQTEFKLEIEMIVKDEETGEEKVFVAIDPIIEIDMNGNPVILKESFKEKKDD